MKHLDFYFDFISPYAYFAYCQLAEIEALAKVTLHPVLFAGLLGHWESKGPAEIPAKRVFTYQYTHWYAERHGIPFRMPPAHPFNPLPLLRLSIACEVDRDAVRKIFDFVWASGGDVDDPAAFQALAESVGVTSPETAIPTPSVKSRLREETENAIARGVFGVPTYLVDGHLFWGVDALPMVVDYLRNPSLMDDSEMRRLAALPAAAARRT